MNTLKNNGQRYKNIRCANFFFIFFTRAKIAPPLVINHTPWVQSSAFRKNPGGENLAFLSR